MDSIALDILHLLDNAPYKWRIILRDELNLVDFSSLSDATMKETARAILQRTNERYRTQPAEEMSESEIAALVQTLIPAPPRFIRALADCILEEHPELAWGDYIPPGKD
ncbi:MAG: hypothetical protein JW709_09755 [Sedimentisphaerales bacterium]|nr:hypothetical protein [Sedimentisphaerales bacterium]